MITAVSTSEYVQYIYIIVLSTYMRDVGSKFANSVREFVNLLKVFLLCECVSLTFPFFAINQ